MNDDASTVCRQSTSVDASNSVVTARVAHYIKLETSSDCRNDAAEESRMVDEVDDWWVPHTE